MKKVLFSTVLTVLFFPSVIFSMELTIQQDLDETSALSLAKQFTFKTDEDTAEGAAVAHYMPIVENDFDAPEDEQDITIAEEHDSTIAPSNKEYVYKKRKINAPYNRLSGVDISFLRAVAALDADAVKIKLKAGAYLCSREGQKNGAARLTGLMRILQEPNPQYAEQVKEVVEVLLTHKRAKELLAEETKDAKRMTALHFAIRFGDLEIVKLLLLAGADPHACIYFANEPWHNMLSLAACHLKIDILKILLEKGVYDAEEKSFALKKFSKEGFSVHAKEREEALKNKLDDQIAELLGGELPNNAATKKIIASYASSEGLNNRHISHAPAATPLPVQQLPLDNEQKLLADLQAWDVDGVRACLAQQPNINYVDQETGDNLLMIALNQDRLMTLENRAKLQAIIQSLLDAGVKVNVANRQLLTPLLMAVKRTGSSALPVPAVIEILLNAGASDIQFSAQSSALTVAAVLQYFDIFEMLLERLDYDSHSLSRTLTYNLPDALRDKVYAKIKEKYASFITCFGPDIVFLKQRNAAQSAAPTKET